jgi:hypothetical protein
MDPGILRRLSGSSDDDVFRDWASNSLACESVPPFLDNQRPLDGPDLDESM